MTFATGNVANRSAGVSPRDGRNVLRDSVPLYWRGQRLQCGLGDLFSRVSMNAIVLMFFLFGSMFVSLEMVRSLWLRSLKVRSIAGIIRCDHFTVASVRQFELYGSGQTSIVTAGTTVNGFVVLP